MPKFAWLIAHIKKTQNATCIATRRNHHRECMIPAALARTNALTKKASMKGASNGES